MAWKIPSLTPPWLSHTKNCDTDLKRSEKITNASRRNLLKKKFQSLCIYLKKKNILQLLNYVKVKTDRKILSPRIYSVACLIVKVSISLKLFSAVFNFYFELENVPPYERHSPSSCGGLQPSAKTVGSFGPNSGALRAKPRKSVMKFFKIFFWKFFSRQYFLEFFFDALCTLHFTLCFCILHFRLCFFI